MKLAALLLVAACGVRADRTPHGNDVVRVPEHKQLGTLPATGETPLAIEIDGDTLAGPETIIHDLDQDVYFVSNINGNPNAADDNG